MLIAGRTNRLVFIFLLFSTISFSACVDLGNPATYGSAVANLSGIYYVNENTVLCTDTYNYQELGNSSNNISTAYPFIYINSSSISLDCNDSVLVGNDSTDSSGIFVYGDSYVNITNCEVRNFKYGIDIRLNNTVPTNCSIENATLYNNTAGLYSWRSLNTRFLNSETYDNTYGSYFIYGSTGVIGENIRTYNNTYGLYLTAGGVACSGKFTNLSAYNNSNSGVRIVNIGTYLYIENSNISDNGVYGLYSLGAVNDIRIEDSYVQENNQWDVIMFPSSSSYCNHNFTNVTGSGGRKIRFFNGSGVNEGNLSVSELVVCGTSGSSFSNMTVNGSDALDNNGILIAVAGSTELNNIVTKENYDGIYFYANDNVTLNNLTTEDNGHHGTYHNSNQNIHYNNITVRGNQYGLYIPGGTYTDINDAVFDDCSSSCIHARGSYIHADNFTVMNSNIAVDLQGSHNKFTNFTIKDGAYGFYRSASISPQHNQIINGKIHDLTGVGILQIVGVNQTMHNIEFYSLSTAISMDRTNVDINNLSIHDISGHALQLLGTQNSLISNVTMDSIGGWAIYSATGWATISRNNTYTNITIYDVDHYIYHQGVAPQYSSKFYNLTIGINDTIGIVEWENVTLNYSYLRKNVNIIMDPYFISLNDSDSGASHFSTDANVILYTESVKYEVFKNSHSTNRMDIIQQGRPLYPTVENLNTSSYPYVLEFKTDSFSGYTTRLNCFEANESDTTYSLLGNAWGNKSNGVCITVTASNVTINCSGYNVTGTFGGMTRGLWALNTDGLEVKNCHFTNYSYGLELNNVTGSYLHDNSAHDNSGYGFYIYESSNNNLTNNTAYGNPNNGFYLESDSNGNTLTGNTAHSNPNRGFQLYESDNNDLISNTAYNNTQHGFYIHTSDDNLISGGSSYDNLQYGLMIYRSDNVNVSNTHLYNNIQAELYVRVSATPGIVRISNITIDRPAGDTQDYTRLTITDNVEANTGYTINWTSGTGGLPSNYTSFENKYIDISSVLGTVSIDSITWHWDDSELGGYNESKFELWKYSGGAWSNTSASLNLPANTLSLTNHNPASGYGILENGNVSGPLGAEDVNGTYIDLYGVNITNVTDLTRWEPNVTGNNLTTEGGNITLANLNSTALTDRWAGYFGNISGDILLTDNASSVSVYLYHWAWNSTFGGIVCSSTNSSLGRIDVVGANGSDIDTAWGFPSSAIDSGVNTFNGSNCTLNIDSASISNASYADTGPAGGFITCALKTQNNPVKAGMLFCTNITYNGTIYSGGHGDFELIVPTAYGPSVTEIYYFYANLD